MLKKIPKLKSVFMQGASLVLNLFYLISISIAGTHLQYRDH